MYPVAGDEAFFTGFRVRYLRLVVQGVSSGLGLSGFVLVVL